MIRLNATTTVSPYKNISNLPDHPITNNVSHFGDGGLVNLRHLDVSRNQRAALAFPVPATVAASLASSPAYSPNQSATNTLCIGNQYVRTPPLTGLTAF